MKVALFVGALNRGGTESLILDVCRCHKIAPFEVVCLYRKEGTYSEDYHNTDAKLVKIEKKGNLLRYLFDIRSFIKREGIDIIHAQTPSNAILSILVSAFLKTKVVTTFHGIFTDKRARTLLQYITRHCEKVCCVSSYERSYYTEVMKLRPSYKFSTVYNGVNFDKIPIRDNAHMNDAHSPIRLCTVGNFVPGRSPWVIAQALKYLDEKGVHNFDFSFIGRRMDSQGWRYDKCVQICQSIDNVHFLGARNDVPELLQTMDGFVYSTENDTFGIAVVEAMAAGLPVIVNDWKVMKEITKEGQWATLFKTEDVEDCANKIEDLLNNLEARKIQARKIAAEVRAEYSIERHMARLAEIYNEVINN